MTTTRESRQDSWALRCITWRIPIDRCQCPLLTHRKIPKFCHEQPQHPIQQRPASTRSQTLIVERLSHTRNDCLVKTACSRAQKIPTIGHAAVRSSAGGRAAATVFRRVCRVLTPSCLPLSPGDSIGKIAPNPSAPTGSGRPQVLATPTLKTPTASRKLLA